MMFRFGTPYHAPTVAESEDDFAAVFIINNQF